MCNRVSLLIWDRYVFALLCFVSGAENSCNPLSQSDSTLNATRALLNCLKKMNKFAFFLVNCEIFLSSDWLS